MKYLECLNLYNKYTICCLRCLINKQMGLFVTNCIFVLMVLSGCAPKSIYLDKTFNPPVYFGQHVVQREIPFIRLLGATGVR